MFALEAATSAVAYLSLALLLGCLTIGGFCCRKASRMNFRVGFFRSPSSCFLCLFAASLVSLLFQGAKLNGGEFPVSIFSDAAFV